MSPDITPLEMKRFIIGTLELDDVQPEDIDDDEPLFGPRFGLDSIDGLELSIALRKKFQTGIVDDKSAGEHLATIRSLVAFVSTQIHS
jgi:acyl carrier protein